MVKQPATNMSADENDEFRILGFTAHEVELILMSVQCMKGSNRFKVGWEVGMKDYASLTNTSISGARAQWRDLSSRLMKLPRLPSQSLSPKPHDGSEIVEDCIIVRDEQDDESASDVADEGDKEDEREAKRKIKMRRKGKQVAKPSVLASLEAGSDEEDNVGATNEAQAKGKDDGVAEPSTSKHRIEQAWADIGDGMDEATWNEMGDRLAL